MAVALPAHDPDSSRVPPAAIRSRGKRHHWNASEAAAWASSSRRVCDRAVDFFRVIACVASRERARRRARGSGAAKAIMRPAPTRRDGRYPDVAKALVRWTSGWTAKGIADLIVRWSPRTSRQTRRPEDLSEHADVLGGVAQVAASDGRGAGDPMLCHKVTADDQRFVGRTRRVVTVGHSRLSAVGEQS